MGALKMGEWLGSKKTKDAILGSVLLIVADKLGVGGDTLMAIGGVFGIKIVGQAAIDTMKAKKESQVNITNQG